MAPQTATATAYCYCPLNMTRSLFSYITCCALILATAFFFYPKWEKPHTEATISWDVSGYYLYLPAVFIYHDLKQLQFFDSLDTRYQPGPGKGQFFRHPSGNYVMKYTMGQALQMLPWFTVAHALAAPLGYPADGFSRPYQAAISWGSLLVALIGLWFLRRILLDYFSESVTAISLLCIVFGSNYLDYTAITGAMTHNWLFTLYTLLIFTTIRFYRKPSLAGAALIGLLVGWAALTRPTEIITALIPLLWGIGSLKALRARWTVWRLHAGKLFLAVLIAGAVVFLQAIYWKYATGEWIVYSYEDQGFSWLHPHLRDVLVSARAGWFVYSPVMFFALPGFFALRRQRPDLFPGILLICLLCLYVTAAWDIWWYGGSLGQRALIQSYPLWAFPLAAFVQWVSNKRIIRILFSVLLIACIYINLWWVYQAHKGGYFLPEQMNTPYLMKILGRWNIEREAAFKLLDTREEFKGSERQNIRELYVLDFEQDTSNVSAENPVSGTKSLYLNKAHQFSPAYDVSLGRPLDQSAWLRASIVFRCDIKEWEFWKMTQFIVRYYQKNQLLKTSFIRLQRHVEGDGQTKNIWFDSRIPKEADRATLLFWNADSDKGIRLDDLKVEVFE